MSEGLKMKYFVLKPGGDNRYALASRRAMQEYAKTIAPENPTLAHELIEWCRKEEPGYSNDPR